MITSVDIDNFPELIQKILICLPLRQRSMFKCVSKTWCNIIINDALPASGLVIFSYQKGDDSARITTLLDVDEDGKSCKALQSFHLSLEIPMLIGSQNGLLLLRSTINSEDTRFIFCNPAIIDETYRYMALPPMDKPLKPWHEAGFLLDKSLPDKFKVVCFKLNAKSITSGKLKSYLFTSDTAKWTDHETIIRKPSRLGFEVLKVYTFYRKADQVSLCYKRKLHWLYKDFVLVYDFDEQFFEIINLPSKMLKNCNSRGLLYESEGVLYYCQSTRKRLVVWAYLLHNDNNSHGDGGEDDYWQTKESVIYKKNQAVPKRYGEFVGSSPNIFCPIAYNEKLQALYLHRRQAIYSYSFKTRNLAKVWSFPSDEETWIGFPYSV